MCVGFKNFPVREKLSQLMISSLGQTWEESRFFHSTLPQSLGESSQFMAQFISEKK